MRVQGCKVVLLGTGTPVLYLPNSNVLLVRDGATPKLPSSGVDASYVLGSLVSSQRCSSACAPPGTALMLGIAGQ